MSGLVFLIAYLSFNMNFPFFEISKIIDFIAFVFFYITIVLISGIDKENNKIEKSVLLFGILTQSAYMLYLYIFRNTDISSIYRYGIYLIIMILLFIIDIYFLKHTGKSKYFIQILMLIVYVLMFVPFDTYYLIAILSIFSILIYQVKNRSYIIEKNERKIGAGFCIGISAILIVIINNFYIMF